MCKKNLLRSLNNIRKLTASFNQPPAPNRRQFLFDGTIIVEDAAGTLIIGPNTILDLRVGETPSVRIHRPEPKTR
ncbi:MAG: hypothetical protein WAV41_00525 [Microgenomates group bacterium]